MKTWSEQLAASVDAGAVLGRFNEWVEGAVEEEQVVYGVQLAAEEILTNLLKYAEPEGEELDMRMECGAGNGVYLRFEDNGKAFDPVKASEHVDTTRALEERETGGLGLHLVRQMADEMQYERVAGRNRLTLRFGGKEAK